jgi:hypothetical protein
VFAQTHHRYKKAEFDAALEFVGKLKKNLCKKVSNEKIIQK